MAGYWCFEKTHKSLLAKVWLIGMSLWFYGYFNLKYLAIMVFSILLNYVLTRWIIHNRTLRSLENSGKEQKHSKFINLLPVLVGIVINIGVLFYFKYFDFFITGVNNVFGSSFMLKHILLPLGISFFTFQQIGCLVDIHRGEVEEVSFVDYALFVSFFPQLIAGPIVSQADMLPQINRIGNKCIDEEQLARGLTLFILGMAKKVLIADTLGKAVDIGYSALSVMNGLDSALIMLWYALQLYFDFSGYCDMACGLAKMLGFELPINFDSPYKSVNIVTFWERWHKTLTRFFTKYVYIPLGGNRRGTGRMFINILIVYFLSGLWHGAGVNFILWGMLHGILFVITRAILLVINKDGRKSADKHINLPSIISTAFTFIYVSAAWVYFRAESVTQGNMLFANMFTGAWNGVNFELLNAFKLPELWYVVKLLHIDRHYVFSQYILMVVFTIVVLLITFVAPNAQKVSAKLKPGRVAAILLSVLLVWCVLSLSGVSTFLYFNF